MAKRRCTLQEKENFKEKKMGQFIGRESKWRMLVIAIFVSSFLFACTDNTEKTVPIIFEGAVDASQTVEVKRGDIILSTFKDAYIIPEVTQLTFEGNGIFDQYTVSVGEYVTKGQVLARADDSSFQEAAKYWKAQMDQKEADYTYNSDTIKNQMEIIALQMKRVYGQIKDAEGTDIYSSLCLQVGTLDQLYNRKDLELSQLQELYQLEYGYAKEKLQDAKNNIGTNLIVAPFSGTIIMTYEMVPGSAINTNDFYVAIAKEGTYCMQTEYVTLKTMETKEKAIGILNGKEYEVTYVPIDSELLLSMQNNHEQIYSSFEIAKPDETMEYGDYATIQLITATYEQILYIPVAAVYTDYQGKYVLLKQGDAKEKVYITVGISDGISLEVESGLKEGESIYVE